MKILNIISGGETGGSRKHVVTLLEQFPKDEVSLLVFQEGALSMEAEANGIHVHYFHQRSRYDLRVINQLAGFINDHQFDIVHTHGPRSNLFGLMIRKKIKAKWFTTVHSDPSLDFIKQGVIGRIFSTLHKIALKKVDFLFAVSERFKKILISYGIQEEQIQTIYNGIDFLETEKFTLLDKSSLGIEDEDFVLTMVARLHPIKGHDLVFQAVKDMKQPYLKVLLVGDGPIEEQLKQKAEEYGIMKNIKFLGFRKDVDRILQLTDVLLLASYSESFPFVLLEASKARKPVITSDVGDVKQLVQNGMGWVFPVGNTNKLRQAIQEAMNKKNDSKLKIMGEDLHDFAEENFSLNRLYSEVRNTYVKVLMKEKNF